MLLEPKQGMNIACAFVYLYNVLCASKSTNYYTLPWSLDYFMTDGTIVPGQELIDEMEKRKESNLCSPYSSGFKFGIKACS